MTIEVQGLAELRAALARMAPELDSELERAIVDAARITAGAVREAAPRRTGRLMESVRPFTESGTVGGVEVTARARSLAYPSGYPYPVKIERQRGFVRRGIAQTRDRVMVRFGQAIDVIEKSWRR